MTPWPRWADSCTHFAIPAGSAGQATLTPLTNSVSVHGKGDDVGYFALVYDVVDGFAERRAPYREAHLDLAQEAHRRGEFCWPARWACRRTAH